MKRAAQIRRKNKKLTVQQSVKKAAAENRAKKRGTKKVGAVKYIEKRETKRTPAKKVYRVKRSSGGGFKGVTRVGAVSVSMLQAKGREMIGSELGRLQVQQMAATTKTKKRQIGKKIAEKKRALKKFL